MSGCGTGCVIFIWVGFLWPVIISIAYLAFKTEINKKGIYFLASTMAGYGMYIAINFLMVFLLRTFIDIEKITENGVNVEILANSLFWVSLFVIFLPPVLSSHLLAKRFSN